MQQRGAQQPGHEGDVLDRVPEPPAAPAELVVGPPAAERDADRQETPGGERPGPHPARPGRLDPAFDQRGDGEREGHGEADIAEIEERRMEGEAGVLQQRVQVAPVRRRREDAREGIRGQDGEGEEADGDPGLHAQHARAQGRRQVAPEARDRGAEQRQDQDPEQHRAFVVPPDAGDLVEHRLGRVGVLHHVQHGEVGTHVGLREAQEGRGDQRELQHRGRLADRHPGGVAAGGADHRQAALDDGDQQGQQQGEVTDLGNHCVSFPSMCCHFPALFRASATSGGM